MARDPVYITSDQPVPHPERFPDTGVPAQYKSLAAGRYVSEEFPGRDLSEDEQDTFQNVSEL